MTDIRIDQVDFTTLFEAPQNYDTIPKTINISGTVADVDVANFTAVIPYSRAGTRADIYLDGNNVKVLGNVGARAAGDVYQSVSSETFSVLIHYSSSDITVTLSVFNGTGGAITLVTQAITVSAVLYDMPIGPLS